MNFLKQILILSDPKGSEKKGYLTIKKRQNSLSCQIKTFGLEKAKNYSLDLSIGNKTLTNILVPKEDATQFDFALSENLDISGEINAMVLIDENTCLLFGSTNGARAEKLSFLMSKNSLATSNESPKSFQNENESESDASKNEIEGESLNEKSETALDEKASNLSFQGEADLKTKSENEHEIEGAEFFEIVKAQVKQMFETYPKFEPLEKIVENSKWVKIDYDSDGLFYALGIIFEKDQIKFICYALPAKKGFAPPKHIENYCDWRSESKDSEDGFYVMYQSAKDGSSLKK